MQDIYDYIDQHADVYVERLQALCRQPSIAAQNVGMIEAAEQVGALLRQLGAEVQLLDSGGFPLVFGLLTGLVPKTLAFYDHYDVQPPEPLDLWQSPPFSAQIRAGRIWARGVADNKGNLVARLCAVEAFQQVRGQLPVHIKFIVEGEEEIGSPSLPSVAEAYADLLDADGCIWEAGYKDPSGRPAIYLGVKGDCYVELSVTGASSDLHSSWGTVVPNPIWRLVWALNSLKDHQERILIPGFYDAVRQPSPMEIDALEQMHFDEQGERRQMGLDGFLCGLTGLPLLTKHIFQPTCTICGIGGGYQGTGLKTVLPNQAKAKLDLRLVPDQDPHQVYDGLCQHLNAHGWGDLKVELLSASYPARTPMADPLAMMVIETARQVYGFEPVVYPIVPGSGPMYDLCHRPRLARGKPAIPAVSIGVGNSESNNHAPNENIVIEDYIQGIKHIAAVLDRYAAI